MARKKAPEAPENHERWMVSYADFITLMFAFFVVMFASSQTDKSRAKAISEAVEKALENGKSMSIPPAVAKVLGGTVDDKGQGNAQMRGPGGAQHAAKEAQPLVEELTPSLKELTKQLAEEIKAGKIEVNMQPRGLVISLLQATFFPSGADTIESTTYTSIEKVANALNQIHNPVRIEGHTDAVPIHTARFRSNWELSAARSIAMMEVLATRFEVPRDRMAIVGYADTIPAADNDTPEGRAKNRRVDIVILSQYALASEPTGKKTADEASAPGKPAAEKPAAGPKK
jgi:chemotaxis protein MotB